MHEPLGEPSELLAPRDVPGVPWPQRACGSLLAAIGWRVVGPWPSVDRFVLIVAPHTSNWELPIGFVAGHACGLLREWPYGFLMKDFWFKGPLGAVMRGIGGLPIDRSTPNAVVRQMAQEFALRRRFFLAITPEGTRRRTEHWKSGFREIALAARVPVVPVSFDYAHRRIAFGRARAMSEDRERDMADLREFFAGIVARHPGKFGPIVLRD